VLDISLLHFTTLHHISTLQTSIQSSTLIQYFRHIHILINKLYPSIYPSVYIHLTMGLIKSAMLMGGGLYAVDKITKASEKRHSSPNSQNRNQQDNQQYQNQGDYSPQRGYNPNQPQIRYNERGEEQHWYPAPSNGGDRQNPSQAAASRAYYDDKARASFAPEQAGHPAFRERQLLDAEPPLYEPRASQQHGFVIPEDERVGSSSGSGFGKSRAEPTMAGELPGKGRSS
jgi:hypothetical protein